MQDNPLNSLPHAYPFRFLDKILELSAERGVAIKNVTADEAFFQGHFKENPIMPGVLIIETMAQLAGLVMNYGNAGKRVAYLAQVKDVKFKQSVTAGDQLKAIAEINYTFLSLANFSVKALVDDNIAAEGELVMAIQGSS
ncbi:MAG: 3-hydroxyacyl-ACP dehydratase FabZ [Deltaproteobacteria bacterium]|nr:3-hydroxyacyl-ACP dehydratase FabZ [Deltaproteobacteria bacterium]